LSWARWVHGWHGRGKPQAGISRVVFSEAISQSGAVGESGGLCRVARQDRTGQRWPHRTGIWGRDAHSSLQSLWHPSHWTKSTRSQRAAGPYRQASQGHVRAEQQELRGHTEPHGGPHGCQRRPSSAACKFHRAKQTSGLKPGLDMLGTSGNGYPISQSLLCSLGTPRATQATSRRTAVPPAGKGGGWAEAL
jgi:hypothetical protein